MLKLGFGPRATVDTGIGLFIPVRTARATVVQPIPIVAIYSRLYLGWLLLKCRHRKLGGGSRRVKHFISEDVTMKVRRNPRISLGQIISEHVHGRGAHVFQKGFQSNGGCCGVSFFP